MILEALTLKGKLIAAGIAAVVIGALLFAFWSFAWSNGYTAGALSNAEPLAACKTTLSQVEAAHESLAKENEQQRLLSDRLVEDVSNAWDSALRSAGSRITYRVRDRKDCGAGEMHVPDATGQPDAAAAKPEVDQAGTVALTVEQINDRLNTFERDAAQLAHLIAFINKQREIHK